MPHLYPDKDHLRLDKDADDAVFESDADTNDYTARRMAADGSPAIVEDETGRVVVFSHDDLLAIAKGLFAADALRPKEAPGAAAR